MFKVYKGLFLKVFICCLPSFVFAGQYDSYIESLESGEPKLVYSAAKALHKGKVTEDKFHDLANRLIKKHGVDEDFKKATAKLIRFQALVLRDKDVPVIEEFLKSDIGKVRNAAKDYIRVSRLDNKSFIHYAAAFNSDEINGEINLARKYAALLWSDNINAVVRVTSLLSKLKHLDSVALDIIADYADVQMSFIEDDIKHMEVDYLFRLWKTLARSGDERYEAVLQRVLDYKGNKVSERIKLKILQYKEQGKREPSIQVAGDITQYYKDVIKNSIHVKERMRVLEGAYLTGLQDKEFWQLVNSQLLDEKTPLSKEKVWMAKALSGSGILEYRQSLEKILAREEFEERPGFKRHFLRALTDFQAYHNWHKTIRALQANHGALADDERLIITIAMTPNPRSQIVGMQLLWRRDLDTKHVCDFVVDGFAYFVEKPELRATEVKAIRHFYEYILVNASPRHIPKLEAYKQNVKSEYVGKLLEKMLKYRHKQDAKTEEKELESSLYEEI